MDRRRTRHEKSPKAASSCIEEHVSYTDCCFWAPATSKDAKYLWTIWFTPASLNELDLWPFDINELVIRVFGVFEPELQSAVVLMSYTELCCSGIKWPSAHSVWPQEAVFSWRLEPRSQAGLTFTPCSLCKQWGLLDEEKWQEML